jgi:hypothetical protein
MGIIIINLTWHCSSCCVCTLTGGILFCVQVYNWITRSSQSKTTGGEIKECQVACKTWGKDMTHLAQPLGIQAVI